MGLSGVRAPQGSGAGEGVLPSRVVKLGPDAQGLTAEGPPHAEKRCLRREVTGILPPLLVSAPRNAEIHGPVRHLEEWQVSAAGPLRQSPPCPIAPGSPRSTAGTAASCWPLCIPAALWHHSTCTGQWADPFDRTKGWGDVRGQNSLPYPGTGLCQACTCEGRGRGQHPG